MKFGLALPHYTEHASAALIAETAQAAEALGFDSLWVSDHIVYPDIRELSRANTIFEPVSLLAFLASATRRVQLGTSVLVAPHRNPIVCAKALATIDQLSGGRLIPCFGTGGIQGEFEALGVPWEQRGPMTDEYLRVMRELWTSQPASFEGRFVRFDAMKFSPKPAQERLPIWVGGNTRRAIRRAVELGDGWHPIRKAHQVLEQDVAHLKAMAEERGRATPPEVSIRMTMDIQDRSTTAAERRPLHGNLDQIVLDLHRYERIGVTHLVLDLLADLPNMTKTMERFARDLRSQTAH